MKAQRESRGMAPLCPNLGTRSGWVINATPQLLYSQKEPQNSLQEAGWTPGLVWMGFGEEKIAFPLPGIKTWTVQPIASCCTKYATLAPSKLSVPQTVQQVWSATQPLGATLQ